MSDIDAHSATYTYLYPVPVAYIYHDVLKAKATYSCIGIRYTVYGIQLYVWWLYAGAGYEYFKIA